MSNFIHETTLKNGEKVLIRQLTTEDAPAFHEFIAQLFASSDFVITTPEEFKKKTVEDTRQRMTSTPEKLWLNFATFSVRDPEKIVGNIELTGVDRLKLKHTGWIGMGLLSAYRGIGLGTALFRHLLQNARLFPDIERIELEVLASNHAGLALYKKMGFVIEGTKRKAFRQPDGRMEDSMIMSLLREELSEDLWPKKK